MSTASTRASDDPLVAAGFVRWWACVVGILRRSGAKLALLHLAALVLLCGLLAAVAALFGQLDVGLGLVAGAGLVGTSGSAGAFVSFALVLAVFQVPLLVLVAGTATCLVVVDAAGPPARVPDALRFAAHRLLPALGRAYLAGLLVVVGTVGLLLPGLYLAVVFSALTGVLFVERAGLTRCFALVTPRFWLAAGRLAVGATPQLVYFVLSFGLLGVLNLGSGSLLDGALRLVLGLPVAVFGTAVLVATYAELRGREQPGISAQAIAAQMTDAGAPVEPTAAGAPANQPAAGASANQPAVGAPATPPVAVAPPNPAVAVAPPTPSAPPVAGPQRPPGRAALVVAVSVAVVLAVALVAVLAVVRPVVQTVAPGRAEPAPSTAARPLTGPELAAAMLARTRQDGSGQYQLRLQVEGSPPDTVHNGSFRYLRDQVSLTVEETMFGIPQATIVLDGRSWYMPPVGGTPGMPPGKVWVECRSTSDTGLGQYCRRPPLRQDTADPAGLLSRLGDAVTIVGSAPEDLVGVPATRYDLRIDWAAAAARETDPAVRSRLELHGGGRPEPSTLWVDAESRPLRWVRDDIETIDYLNWGTPVEITPPPAELTTPSG